MRFFIIVFLILLTLTSCSSNNNEVVDVSGIDVEFLVNRYEVDFYRANQGSLPLLKNKYPYLFPNHFQIVLQFLKCLIKKN